MDCWELYPSFYGAAAITLSHKWRDRHHGYIHIPTAVLGTLRLCTCQVALSRSRISLQPGNSGVVDLISRYIAPLSKNKIIHITTLSGVVAICSAIMNNVGALALMLPVAIKTSLKQKRSPSILLMPLAFASILGGMITMIGTPPNILISEGLTNAGLEPFKMFDFAPVGISALLAGTLFMTLIGRHLLPKRDITRDLGKKSRTDVADLYHIQEKTKCLQTIYLYHNTCEKLSYR